MKLKYFIVLLSAISINSICYSPEYIYYKFDPRVLKENEITLSKIADDVTYIPLENSFPIGNVRSFKFINQSIYFYYNDGILAFDRAKNRLVKIGSKGRGPGEYLFNTSFTVDEKTETVYVLDQGDIIKTYSKSGLFLRSFPLKRNGSSASIDFFQSKLIVSYALQFGDSKYSWAAFDTLGNEIKKRETGIPTFSSIYGTNDATYKLENRLFYWNSYVDTVFSVLPDLTQKPSFIISPGEHRYPRSRSVPISPFEKYMVLNTIFESSRYIVIRYYFKKPMLLLYDKNDKESFLMYLKVNKDNPIDGILNDLDGGQVFMPMGNISDKGREYMFGLVDPFRLKALVESNEFKNSTPKYPEKKKELEKLANSLKETDNPVLVMVRLKK